MSEATITATGILTPADSAIARRLRVQCERFGWAPGMRAIDEDGEVGLVALEYPPDSPGLWLCWTYRVGHGWDQFDTRAAVPDPHDPATVGCFAAMARKATARRLYAVPTIDGDAWQVCEPASFGENEPAETAPDGSFGHATEIEAWLAVLEAPP